MKKRNSFTLIELLIVIAILAGFVALLVPNFMEIRLKARDTKRKGDLFSMQKALELYKQSQTTPTYPAALPSACTSLTDGNGVYMQKIPQEPLTQCGEANVANYYYKRDPNGVGNDDEYILAACLENARDPEKSACPGDFDTNTTFACVSSDGNSWCYQLTEP